MPPVPPASRIVEIAQRVGLDWIEAPYFAEAEAHADAQWRTVIAPCLAQAAIDFADTLDLAAGRGRHAAPLLARCTTLRLVDIRPENIAACRKRFGDDPRVSYHITDGCTLPVPDGAVSFVFCFDAMVHFDSDVVRAYLAEIRRALRPGGHAFLHHSNDDRAPGGDFHRHPAWRNFMSLRLMAHYASKEGLEVLRQQPLDWLHDGSECDGLTLLRAPATG